MRKIELGGMLSSNTCEGGKEVKIVSDNELNEMIISIYIVLPLVKMYYHDNIINLDYMAYIQ